MDMLKTLKGKRAFIVIGGGSVRKSGLLDKATGYLKEAGFETCIYEGVENDPSTDTVLKGAKAMEDFKPDWIIPIGGGSPIDAAKAMWALYEHPGVSIYDINNATTTPMRGKARFLVIPTTSGTGSEVTSASVLCDSATNVKFAISGNDLTPDIAILDPEATDTMPKTLIAHSGLDALTHAFESFVSKFSSPFTDAQALYAAKMIFDCLPAAYAGDTAAKEAMHYAQCMAGMAFANAMLGISHAMAHKTGCGFDAGHIPHGLANASYIPYVIQYNSKAPAAGAKYAILAKYLGVEGETDDGLARGLAEKTRALASSLGSPKSLRKYGIPLEEWDAKICDIAANAASDRLVFCNPRGIDAETMQKVFQYIYDGKDIDF